MHSAYNTIYSTRMDFRVALFRLKYKLAKRTDLDHRGIFLCSIYPLLHCVGSVCHWELAPCVTLRMQRVGSPCRHLQVFM
jgi:hypothetical protein